MRNIEAVKLILKLMGKSEDLIEFTMDRLGYDFRYSLSSDKMRRQFCWERKISFHKGIEETVKWYRDNTAWANSKFYYLNKYWDMVYKCRS